MKNYKVVRVGDQFDLVNIFNDQDRYWIAEDQDFKEGDIVNEYSFILEECMFVDDEGYGKAPFAFKVDNHESKPLLYREHKHTIDQCLSMLKKIEVDGETMQYILEKLGQDDQMHLQLVRSKPIKDTLEILAERIDLESK